MIEGRVERLKFEIDEWRATTPEANEEFIRKILPEFRAIKEGVLRNPAREETLPEEKVLRSLSYLEKRLRALQAGDAIPMARIAGSIAGYILVRWEGQEQRVQMEQFYVDLTYQSRGVGTGLLRAALQTARELHPSESLGVFLTTGDTNERAQYMYQKEGFHVSAIPAKDEGEIRLEYDLKRTTL